MHKDGPEIESCKAIHDMHKDAPDIETCKRIIDSTELRTKCSMSRGIASLAIAGIFIWLSHRNIQVLDGVWYLDPYAALLLLGAITSIARAYRHFVIKKQDCAFLWLAKDHLSRLNAAVIARNAEQIAVADRHQHHSLTPTTHQSPGG